MEDPEFGVESFKREIGMSRTQLHRKLKALTGQSTASFVKSIRLKRAVQLLRESQDNISDVAYAIGYQRVSTFITDFKKHYNITPLQYRKQRIQPERI